MAAGWIALSYMHISFMPAVGLSTAVTSIVGRHIGSGAHDIAAHRCHLGLKMAIAWMTLCGIFFFFFRHQLTGLFIGGDATPEQEAEILRIGGQMMICIAFFQTLDAVGIIYSGALKGAGDTFWPGMVSILYSWVFIIGLGVMFVTWWPDLESMGPWIAAGFYLVLLGVTMAWRFERGGWRKIRLLDDDGIPGDGPRRDLP